MLSTAATPSELLACDHQMVPGVIFDVDGTLIDNSYFHTIAWFRACREFAIPVDMATLHRLVGMGGDTFVPALIGRDMPELDEAHGRHMKAFQDEAPVIAGAGDLILAVHQRGALVVVATSADNDSATTMLARVVPDRSLIHEVVTSDDVATSKPAPDLVAVALRKSGLSAADAMFIGDTAWDIEASGRCGVRCVGVRTGGWSDQELRDAGAVAVYASVGELLEQLPASPLAGLLSS